MPDKPPDDKDGLLELIKMLWLPVAGLIGAVTLAYNFYKLWLGDQTTVTYIIGGAGLLVLVIALGWVGFKTKEVEVKTIATRKDQKETTRIEKRSEFSPKYQWGARVALSLVLVGMIWSGYSLNQRIQVERTEAQLLATQQTQATQTQTILNLRATQQASQTQQAIATQNSQATQQVIQTQQVQATQYAQATAQAQQELENKLIVIIATFDGPEEIYGLRNEIVESLNSAFSQNEEIEIVTVKDVITPDMGSPYARNLGKQFFADLVIWGWYRPTEEPNITMHIENLSPTQIKTIETSETYQPEATIEQLESFEIQRQIGSETSTLLSFLIGTLKYKSGDYQIAIDYFEQILFDADTSTLIKQFDLFFDLAYSYNNLGDYEKAIQDYDKAIKVNPGKANAYNNRGWAYYLLKQYDRAIQDYDKAIKLDPEFALAYNNRGIAYKNLKQYDRAIQDYNKAVELDPEFNKPYNNRGNVYRELDDYERAILEYDKAIEIDPGYALAYYNRGRTYYYLGQYERAIQDFDKSIELNPDYSYTYAWRGYVYENLEQYEDAIQDYSKNIELDPEYAWAYQHRGYAYQAINKTAEAEADFKKYEELTGEKP